MKRNAYMDGMMGLVVGDALGCPVQFLSREEIKNRPQGPVTGMEAGGVYAMPKGTWTDDSSMALATLVSLLDKGEVDPADIMSRFAMWERKGEYTPFGKAFDQGNTCVSAIYRYIQNPDVETCGATGEYANGNGALMRILPVCLHYCDRRTGGDATVEEAIHGIHKVGGLTHNHLRSQICCGIYYFLVRSILEGITASERPAMLDLLQRGMDAGLEFYRRDAASLAELAHLGRVFDLEHFRTTPESGIKSTGYVIDTLEAALWCLLHTDSYRDCLLMAVNLGDDADTVAAVAGGLAGLYYGYDAIPDEWLGYIKRREWIEGVLYYKYNDNNLELG